MVPAGVDASAAAYVCISSTTQHVTVMPSVETKAVWMHRLLGQLSQIQQQLVQPGCHHNQVQGMQELSLSADADRLAICFVIATVQVETAAQFLKVQSLPLVHGCTIIGHNYWPVIISQIIVVLHGHRTNGGTALCPFPCEFVVTEITHRFFVLSVLSKVEA